MSTYAARNESLLKLGFKSYEQYLVCELWRSIRSKVLNRDRRRCVVCSGPASEVHHKSYAEAVLRGAANDQLVAICTKCHEAIEFVDGKKLFDLAEINRRLEARIRSHRSPAQQPKKPAKKYNPAISFGLHKGRRFSEIPRDYLKWVATLPREKLLLEMASAQDQVRHYLFGTSAPAAKKRRARHQAAKKAGKKRRRPGWNGFQKTHLAKARR